MPSDDRISQVMAALAAARRPFHDAVVGAVEELRGYIAARRPAEDADAAGAASLGRFAHGLVDTGRFGAFFARDGRLTPEELGRLEQAIATLREFAGQGDDPYLIRVAVGADLRDAVRAALAERGRAFAVARGAERIRTGRGQVAEPGEPDGFPFRLWNRAERQIAPPLVIEVAGGDLQVAGLAEYLDGRQKLVLVVREPSPAAPLTRLIGPHVFVQQTSDPGALQRLAAFDGPGIAAVVPAGCAAFTWDPSGGPRFEQRLQVEHMPAEEPQAAIGAVGVTQQQADVQWLRELSELRARGLAGMARDEGGEPALADPADLLAAWLLRQTDLRGM